MRLTARSRAVVASVIARVEPRASVRARPIARGVMIRDEGDLEDAGALGTSSDSDASDVARARRDGPTRTERRRRARFNSVKLECPACGQEIRSNALRMHLQKCARDLSAAVPSATWTKTNGGDVNEGARRALALATEANEAFETRVKRMCYRRRGEEDGERATPEACAAELGVPVDRVKMTLRRASLKIDLVRDETPLDVVFEDDEFLVVNKPPNLRFHPNHRFEGNSLLSRALHHLDGADATPYIVHRLDMDTSGVAVFVKKHSLVSDVARQFQEKTAKKTYLAVSVGVAPPECGDSFVVDAPIGDHGIVREARTVSFDSDGKEAKTTCEIVSKKSTTLFDIMDESVAAMTTPKAPGTRPAVEYIETKSVAEVSVTSNFCSWLRVTSSWMFTKSSVSLMNWSIASSSAYVLSMCAKYVSSRSSTTCRSESSWCGNSSSPNTSSTPGLDGVDGSFRSASGSARYAPPC